MREPSFPGEHLAYDSADFEVDIQLTNPNSADGLPLTIAASALDKGSHDQHTYRLEGARNFAWSVSDQYQVLNQPCKPRLMPWRFTAIFSDLIPMKASAWWKPTSSTVWSMRD